MPTRTNIKNLALEKRLFQRRLWGSIMVVILLGFLLILRLAYLQIFNHHHYATLSKKNYLELLPIEPNRGLIYDRNGVLLAENIPVFSLEVTPAYVKNLPHAIKALKKIITISPNDLEQFYKELKSRTKFDAVPLKLKLTANEVARFSVNQYRFPGMIIETRMIRKYPLGDITASVVGYVGRINSTELKQVDTANYRVSNFIGKTGVEKYYEQLLHGKVGYKQVEIDASGRPLRLVKTIASQAGANIYLTIDSKLQAVALKALGKENGAVVAIQPKTGQVLALVSNPSFDPNIFVKGLSEKQFKTLENDLAPLYIIEPCMGNFLWRQLLSHF